LATSFIDHNRRRTPAALAQIEAALNANSLLNETGNYFHGTVLFGKEQGISPSKIEIVTS